MTETTSQTASQTIPAEEKPPAPPAPWTAGRVAFVIFRILWSLVLAQAIARWLEADRGIPFFMGFALAAPGCWWLSGLFRRWGRRREPASNRFAVGARRAGDIFFRGVWSLAAAMIAAQLTQLHFALPAAPAWLLGGAVGVGWFWFCRRFDDSAAIIRFFAPASLPLGMVFAELAAMGLLYIPFIG